MFALHPRSELVLLVLDSHSFCTALCPACCALPSPDFPTVCFPGLQTAPGFAGVLQPFPGSPELGAKATWHRANPCVPLGTAALCLQIPHSKPGSAPWSRAGRMETAGSTLNTWAEHKLSWSDPKSLLSPRLGPLLLSLSAVSQAGTGKLEVRPEFSTSQH